MHARGGWEDAVAMATDRVSCRWDALQQPGERRDGWCG